jgi:hypothetical protein
MSYQPKPLPDNEVEANAQFVTLAVSLDQKYDRRLIRGVAVTASLTQYNRIQVC